MRRRRTVSCFLILAAATVAAAQDAPRPGVPELGAPRRELERAEQARAAEQAASLEGAERARALQEEVARLAQTRIEAAERLRATEQEAADAAARVDALAERRAAAERRLAERSAALGPALPLIERLALYPAETLLAAPAAPEVVLRGLLVLRGLTRQLERDAAGLRAEQAEIAHLARAAEAELPLLRAAQASQRAQAAALDAQLAARRAAAQQGDEAAHASARRVAAQAARAETLRAAVAALEAEQERAAARERAEAAQERRRQLVATAPTRPRGPSPAEGGAFRPPMAGTVVRGWGERTEAGPASGVLLRGAPGARVVAPCAGKVAFAGPFRSFGKLIILECGAGLHAVLSGLDRLDADVGERVRAGEPVGAMPGWEPGTPGARPSLYLELRRDGRPMDPAPFLRAQR